MSLFGAETGPLSWTLLGILAGLTAITLAIWIRTDGPSELRSRVITWWWIVGLFTLALLFGTVLSLILFGLISFMALKEYLSMIPTRRADRSLLLWAYLSIPVQYFFVGMEWYGMFIIFIPVYLFLLLPALMVTRGETDQFLRAAGTLHWGVMLCVFLISHAAYLLEGLPAEAGMSRNAGIELLIFLLVITALNDVFQYTSGKLLGGRIVPSFRPAPAVSPNKTWEGVVGGIIGSVIVAALISLWLTPIPPLWAALIGGLLSIAGLIGDLVISALKRDLGLKDSGSILPGHGGILDRIDSLIFTAPLFLHIVRYFYF